MDSFSNQELLYSNCVTKPRYLLHPAMAQASPGSIFFFLLCPYNIAFIPMNQKSNPMLILFVQAWVMRNSQTFISLFV